MSGPVICWFRRDLRLSDHMALTEALKSGGEVLPLFIFDPQILQSPRFSPARYAFMLAAIEALNARLQAHGGGLLIRYGKPLEVLPALMRESGAAALYFNVDYTPYARQRDEAVSKALGQPVMTFHDRLLVKPDEIEKNDGGPYTVYTPFKNKWREQPKAPHQAGDDLLASPRFYEPRSLKGDPIPTLANLGHPEDISVPPASEAEAQRRLDDFLSQGIYHYAERRDALGSPDEDPRTGTSFLSPYIRFGVLSLRRIYWAARAAYDQAKDDPQRESVKTFVDEITWHEFYTHILWHFPQVKTRNFNRKYDKVAWQQDADLLQAWKEGRTGYPVVDAAMRQLNSLGWMHNRARMIVASFLTKDLLIDWREGELYFMQCLLDGDLAANNGGWQWAAGTGTDAQPYFRIFNPVAQSKKFDPQGAYIRRWVPELRDVPDKYIHEPWKMPNPPRNYPAPVVDHAQARQRTLAAFEATKNP